MLGAYTFENVASISAVVCFARYGGYRIAKCCFANSPSGILQLDGWSDVIQQLVQLVC